MKAIVYVDGFNLFYNCFKGKRNLDRRHLRWLDLRRLAEQALPHDSVVEINYYTAMVSGSSGDASRPQRQQAYLQSLDTVAGIRIHRGQFRKSKRTGRLIRSDSDMGVEQTVEIMQEKGSDVSLATHLLLDAFQDRFELAVLISNDSDYAEPVRAVTTVLGKSVGILSPDIQVSKQLAKLATFARPLDLQLLETSQLPDEINRDDGTVLSRPAYWAKSEISPPAS